MIILDLKRKHRVHQARRLNAYDNVCSDVAFESLLPLISSTFVTYSVGCDSVAFATSCSAISTCLSVL